MNEQTSGRTRGQSATANSVVARRRTGPMEPGPQSGPPIPSATEGGDIPVLFRLPQVGARPAAATGRSHATAAGAAGAAPATKPSAPTPAASDSAGDASATAQPSSHVNAGPPGADARPEAESSRTTRSTERRPSRLSALRGVTSQWFIVGVVAVVVVGGVAWWRNHNSTNSRPGPRNRAPLVLNIDEGTEATELEKPGTLEADSDRPVARLANRGDEPSRTSASRTGAPTKAGDEPSRTAPADHTDAGPQLDLQPPLMSPPNGTETERRPTSDSSNQAPPLTDDLSGRMDEPVPPRPTNPDSAAFPDLSSGADGSTQSYPRTNPATYLYRDESATTVARRNDDNSTESRGTR